jgi:hypothetical protein
MRFSPRLACIATPLSRLMALFTLVTLASCRVPTQVPGEKPFKDYRLAFMMD